MPWFVTSPESSSAPSRIFTAALVAFLALVSVNMLAVFYWPSMWHDAWAKLCNYNFNVFSLEGFARAWALHAWEAVVAAAVIAAAAGWGGVVLALVRRKNSREGLLACVGLGFGVLGLAGLGLGAAGLLFAAPAGAFVAAGAALLAVRGGRERMEELRKLAGLADFGRAETRWLAAAAGVVGLVSFLVSLAPEGGWDAVYYHLRLPKLYALHHGIFFVPYIYPSHYPQMVEMLYTFAWLGGGEGAAKLVNFSFWIFAGLALFDLSSVWGGKAAVRAVALALTMPLAGTLAAESYIDLGLTFFEVLALSSVLRGRPLEAGLLAGFAMGSKYTGVFAAGALLVSLPFLRWPPRRVVLAAVAAALPVLPWLGRNALFTGDPVAPFLYGALGRLDWAGGISQAAMHGVIPQNYPRTIWDMAVSVFVAPWMFLEQGAFAIMLPFIFGMLPALALRSRSRPEAFLKSWFLLFTLAILVFSPDGRYWQPAVFPFCLLAALAWERLETGEGRWRRAIPYFAGLSLAFGAVYHVIDMHCKSTCLFVALGFEDRGDYEERTRVPWGSYATTVRWLNRNIPRGEKVAVVSDVQAFLLNHEAVFDCDAPHSTRWILGLARRSADPDAIARQFRRWNCRTVFYIRSKAIAAARNESWGPVEAGRWRRFWDTRAVLLRRSGPCVVYELSRKPHPSRIPEDLAGLQEWILSEMLAKPDHAGRKAVYRRGLAAGVESAYLCGTYGEITMNDGFPAEGAEELRKSVRLAPDLADAWFSLARALLRSGRPGEARQALARGERLEPGSPDLNDLRNEFARAVNRN